MLLFRKLIFGSDYYNLKCQDSVLSFFKHTDNIDNSLFYSNNHLNNFDLVIKQLEIDKMIELSPYGVLITLAGKSKIRKGGYLRVSFIKRLKFLIVIASFIIGVIGLTFSILK